MKLIFAGSSAFGIPALQKLVDTNPPLLVISQPPKVAGRNLRLQMCPVADFAEQKGLNLFHPEDINSRNSLDRIRELQPDLLITASYGGMLKRDLRHIPRLGAINLHPSLLPLYRGATPIQSALLDNAPTTGVSIFRLNAKMDAGALLSQTEMQIDPKENHGSLHTKLADLAASMLLDLLPKLELNSIIPREQEQALATFTHKINKDDLLLKWDMPAIKVLSSIRAFSPVPGAHTLWNGIQLKILAASVTGQPANNTPGSIAEIIKNTGFTVNCRDTQLQILTVQPSGKKAMDAWAFQLGARLTLGYIFFVNPEPQNNPQPPSPEEP